jgi:hypothetical protein
VNLPQLLSILFSGLKTWLNGLNSELFSLVGRELEALKKIDIFGRQTVLSSAAQHQSDVSSGRFSAGDFNIRSVRLSFEEAQIFD